MGLEFFMGLGRFWSRVCASCIAVTKGFYGFGTVLVSKVGGCGSHAQARTSDALTANPLIEEGSAAPAPSIQRLAKSKTWRPIWMGSCTEWFLR